MTQSQPVISLGSLRRALSDERLAAYSTSHDTDEIDPIARYLWNAALATAMVPTLHALEITLRNNLYAGSLRIVDEASLTFREVTCWLDAEPTLLYEHEAANVEE
ncbi:MAG: hypothetical protein RQ751_11430, partial [Longimicrobiales bacterium]|nr:hypothetical protein [Longimicrobiales bacterium]